MKHAYLIIAHTQWQQLKLLLQCLDSENTDIYIHIDKKAKDVPVEDLKHAVTKSEVKIYSKYKVYWGGYGMIQAELFLFGKAHEHHYDYYHLLSESDLPIKPQKDIDRFFEKNAGYEFVQFDTDERLKSDSELQARIKWYHFFQDYRNRFHIKIFNSFFTFIERCSYFVQMLFKVDRTKKQPEIQIKYGSVWVSITDELVAYLLQNQSLIEALFKYTKCSDEFFIQTIVFNSDFRNRLYDQDFDNDVRGNKRLIDWERRSDKAHPRIWESSDWKEIQESDCLFARKFSLEEDAGIVKKVCEINNVHI